MKIPTIRKRSRNAVALKLLAICLILVVSAGSRAAEVQTLADDELAIRHVFTKLLQKEGHEVIPATNGQEAVDLFDEHRPDLVLLDVMMPKLNGFEVCEHIKSDPENQLNLNGPSQGNGRN